MNKEEIDKWLDEEYGCSYTRLEELHDFYFEKYIDLKEEKEELKKWLEEKMSIYEYQEASNFYVVLNKIKELEEGVK